jgi:hypothetical protein
MTVAENGSWRDRLWKYALCWTGLKSDSVSGFHVSYTKCHVKRVLIQRLQIQTKLRVKWVLTQRLQIVRVFRVLKRSFCTVPWELSSNTHAYEYTPDPNSVPCEMRSYTEFRVKWIVIQKFQLQKGSVWNDFLRRVSGSKQRSVLNELRWAEDRIPCEMSCNIETPAPKGFCVKRVRVQNLQT